MTDDVLSVRYSPNSKFLAVALLDSTVKVFYLDTLKFFLSLYGHKVSDDAISHELCRINCMHKASSAVHGYLCRLQIDCDMLR